MLTSVIVYVGYGAVCLVGGDVYCRKVCRRWGKKTARVRAVHTKAKKMSERFKREPHPARRVLTERLKGRIRERRAINAQLGERYKTRAHVGGYVRPSDGKAVSSHTRNLNRRGWKKKKKPRVRDNRKPNGPKPAKKAAWQKRAENG